MEVTCRDCALPYETWPERGCGNCGCGEPLGGAAPAVEATPRKRGRPRKMVLPLVSDEEREAPGIEVPADSVERESDLGGDET